MTLSRKPLPIDTHFARMKPPRGGALMNSHLTLGLMKRISINDMAPAPTIANSGMMDVPPPVFFFENDSVRAPS